MDKFYCGKRGSGKGVRSTVDIWLDWFDGYEIYSNTWLHPAFNTNYITKEKGNLHIIDGIDLINMMINDRIPDTDTPKVCLLDEIKTQASSRGFGTYINRYLTDFISQARKRRFKMIYTDQILVAYDRWMRLMTDKLILCSGIPDPSGDLGWGTKDYPEPLAFEYAEADINDIYFDNPIVYDIQRVTARRFYPLFRTTQTIKSLALTDRGKSFELSAR